ncbi:Trm112 family protein [Amycolatopsis sp. CA-161197]|uniref:Trm112 family protein n=1 Tax=unclassified Amycolatopsis TaxID=2618356 RepID=UPI00345534F3
MAITLDAQLLEILACPSPDHAPLRPGTPDDADAEALTCTECGRVYPVRDGIPVLLLDEAVLSGDRVPGTPGRPDDSHADSA